MLEFQGLAYLHMAKFQSNLRRKNIDFQHQNAYKIGFLVLLEFTPLEFETKDRRKNSHYITNQNLLRWSLKLIPRLASWANWITLEFTPLEFETSVVTSQFLVALLEFTPLEFETLLKIFLFPVDMLLEFTPLEFDTRRNF